MDKLWTFPLRLKGITPRDRVRSAKHFLDRATPHFKADAAVSTHLIFKRYAARIDEPDTKPARQDFTFFDLH